MSDDEAPEMTETTTDQTDDLIADDVPVEDPPAEDARR